MCVGYRFSLNPVSVEIIKSVEQVAVRILLMDLKIYLILLSCFSFNSIVPSECKSIEKRSTQVECGIARTVAVGFIFGGGSIQPKEHPWKAALLKNLNGVWTYICGGVLIDKRSVITGMG